MADVSRRVRWRNGGGWTTVLAQSEGGEPFQWRIAVAEIERDGPFSDYSGYDRTIVAQDAGFTLEFADGERVEILPMIPFAFAGERTVHCRLHRASASAFNVLTLRSAFAHEVRVVDDEIEVQLTPVDSPNTRARGTSARARNRRR
jgi:environmental stress-induced protein Ves